MLFFEWGAAIFIPKKRKGRNLADDNGLVNTSFFVDDGFRGTNFDKPDWQRLIALAEDGGVAAIIVKDMSRLGRDYLRISKRDIFIQKPYEDNVEGKINDERFIKMSATYEAEQKQLEKRVSGLQSIIDSVRKKSANADPFLKRVHQFTDIQESDAQIIRTFEKRINVYAAEKVGGRRGQRIQIIYDCIGEFHAPTKGKRHSRYYYQLCRIFQKIKNPLLRRPYGCPQHF